MVEFLQGWGYIGLFVGAFLAATIIPFSSDILLIGILLAGGDPWISFLSATAGNWLGGLTSYGLGRIGKWEWIEKWFHVSEEKLLKQKSKIDLAAFRGRCLCHRPGILQAELCQMRCFHADWEGGEVCHLDSPLLLENVFIGASTSLRAEARLSHVPKYAPSPRFSSTPRIHRL